jgi:sterol desaturase/sphingolipid hydroxylase (fatty acid hydroxylase superfamily)
MASSPIVERIPVTSSVVHDFEPLIRIAAFLGVFGAVALWEWAAPRRVRGISRSLRWPNNIGLLIVDTLALRLVAPGAAVAIAVLAEARGWGLLNYFNVALAASVPLGLLILDLAIYGQHAMFHALPPLWRLHRVHHADLEFDVTTGTRFHPLEILISTAIKCAVVLGAGVPAIAVLAFEVLLNASSMFNHANASLPPRMEKWMRWLVVTPDMHRVHHSIVRKEHSSNFGFNLPWWDRVFGTYRAQPEAGHIGMTLGVDAFRSSGEQRLDRLLTQPFRASQEPRPA